jgi:signal transduction histidine kinase
LDKSILIVDDEKRMTDSLRDLLSSIGYTVTTTNSGEEAIAELKRQRYPLVITDLRMQGAGGLDIMRHIDEHTPRTLVIVITGYASTESAIEAVHYHAFDYLRKPFEFEDLKRVIERAFQKIELDQLREDTAAMITHDIKVPLTSILGFASLIYNRDKEQFHPRAREYTEMIRSSARKILALVDNYLTSAKQENATLHLHALPTHLFPLIDELMETYMNEAERRGIRLEVYMEDAPPRAVLDEALIYRATANLIYNAVKYGDPAEPIRLKVSRVDAAASGLDRPALRIEVSNRAPHLKNEDLNALFHRFKRAQKDGGVEGSGIGLYVVDAVARAHEGIARAEHLDGGRVAFSITLPMNLEPIATLPAILSETETPTPSDSPE